MQDGPGDELEPTETDAVELISDGENLLVLGESRLSVEAFLRSKGLLEKARQLSRHQLAPALRSSADLVKTISEAVAESSLWLKITPESARAIDEYGLTDSGIPGVAYAVAGARGHIKEWIRVDTTTRASFSNPGLISGAAGLLAQAARRQEAEQLRDLLESLGKKIDEVLRGQKDEIIGDLDGIERQIRVTQQRLNTEGDVDALTWSTLFGASIGLRQVQAKALRKLHGIAGDLEAQKRFGVLNQRLQEAKGEVRVWISVIARCVTALDELAVLEMDHCAVLDPARLDARRVSLDIERRDDRVELDQGIELLLRRMDEATAIANQNKLFHRKGVPKALDSIEEARDLVKRVYEALGVEVDWESVDPIRWRDAIRQARQWTNGLHQGGSFAWEKGKPIVGTLAASAAIAVATAMLKGKLEPPSHPKD